MPQSGVHGSSDGYSLQGHQHLHSRRSSRAHIPHNAGNTRFSVPVAGCVASGTATASPSAAAQLTSQCL
eukprot:1137900-Pelagomonas_calceolata.AAC.5